MTIDADDPDLNDFTVVKMTQLELKNLLHKT